MTEAEWLGSGDPEVMLDFVRGRVSDRKLRLFACGCCRRIWNLWDVRARNAVEAAEQFADGLADRKKLDAARTAIGGTSLGTRAVTGGAARIATDADAWQAARNASRNAAWVAANQSSTGGHWERERQIQASLLRDIVGNPFRPPPPLTLTSIRPVALAGDVYAGTAGHDHLRQALLEAGQKELAEHFHDGRTHPKGCHVVDLILGKK